MRHETTNWDGFGSEKIRFAEFSGTPSRLAQKKHFAEARTLFLQAVEEPSRPYEFGRKNAERQKDGEPSGPRRHNHGNPQNGQSEPEEDF
jgi:hypothetical protein